MSLPYTLTDSDGDRVIVYAAISSTNSPAEIHVEDNTDTQRTNFAYVTKEDAPAFALAVLEATGYGPRKEGEVYTHMHAAVDKLQSHLAEQAKAKEAEQLDKEATALASAGHHGVRITWGEEEEAFKTYWRTIAKKARELHGKDSE